MNYQIFDQNFFADIGKNAVDIANNTNEISAGISTMGDNIEVLNVSLFLHLIKEPALDKQYFFCNNCLDFQRNCMIILKNSFSKIG